MEKKGGTEIGGEEGARKRRRERWEKWAEGVGFNETSVQPQVFLLPRKLLQDTDDMEKYCG